MVERFAFWGGVSCRRCFTPNTRRTPPGAPTILGGRRANVPLPPSARSHRMLWVRVGEREPLLPPAVPLRRCRMSATSAEKTGEAVRRARRGRVPANCGTHPQHPVRAGEANG